MTLSLVLGASACVHAGRGDWPSDRDQLLATMQEALRAGDVLTTEGLLARARQRYPIDTDVLRLDALMADMRWRDEIAIADLKAICRLESDPAAIAEASGRAGEKLFMVGYWRESEAHLRAAIAGEAESPERSRRQAWADLARSLPAIWRGPTSVEASAPLASEPLPELLLGVGERGGAFVLDTGATITTLSMSLARALGVEPLLPGGEVSDGAGQPFSVHYGILQELLVGAVRLGPLPVLVVSDQVLAMRDLFGGPGRAVDGLLGLDVIVRFRVEVDAKARLLTVSSPRGIDAAHAVPALRVDGGLRIPVVVEGRSLWFQLDTGASHSSLTPAGVRELPGGDLRAAAGFRIVHSPGGTRYSVRELRSLEVRASGAIFSEVDLPVVDRPAGATGLPLHGVIGADLVSRCRMIFERGRLVLEVR